MNPGPAPGFLSQRDPGPWPTAGESSSASAALPPHRQRVARILRQPSSTNGKRSFYMSHRVGETLVDNRHPTTRTSWVDLPEATAFVPATVAVGFLVAAWNVH
jgi:hypothetical protein